MKIGWAQVNQKASLAGEEAEKTKAEKIDFEIWVCITNNIEALDGWNAFGLNFILRERHGVGKAAPYTTVG